MRSFFFLSLLTLLAGCGMPICVSGIGACGNAFAPGTGNSSTTNTNTNTNTANGNATSGNTVTSNVQASSNSLSPSGALTLASSNVSSISVGVNKPINVAAAGGSPPYRYKLTGNGVLNASGVFTAPSVAGSSQVTVTDSRNAQSTITIVYQ